MGQDAKLSSGAMRDESFSRNLTDSSNEYSYGPQFTFFYHEKSFVIKGWSQGISKSVFSSTFSFW